MAGEARQIMKPQFGPFEYGTSAAKWTLACGDVLGSSADSGGADGANHESESIKATRLYRRSANASGGSLQ